MRRVALALVIGSVGCGDDAVEPSEFAAVCGTPGPVRVLPLEPTERLWGAPRRVMDRDYYTVRPSAGYDTSLSLAEASVWSSGPCGESPIRVAERMVLVDGIERWPDVVLGCEYSTGRVFRLDPGGGAPKLAFDTGSCSFEVTEQGLVSQRGRDENSAMLLFHPYPEEAGVGGTETLVVLDPIPLQSYRVSSEGVYATTPDGALMRFDLADRTLSAVRTGVLGFEVSADGRYVLMEELAENDDLDDGTPRLNVLLDRQTGITASLGVSSSSPSYVDLEYAEQGALLFGGHKEKRLYSLPDLNFVDVPEGYDIGRYPPLPDGRWIIADVFDKAGWLKLFDPRDGSTTTLFGEAGSVLGRADDGVYVLDSPTPEYSGSGGGSLDVGPVWFVSFDGSQARRVTGRASAVLFAVDGADRAMTAVGTDLEDLATLLAIDLVSGEARRVDERVYVGLDVPGAFESETVMYSVVDGERSGVWIARPVR